MHVRCVCVCVRVRVCVLLCVGVSRLPRMVQLKSGSMKEAASKGLCGKERDTVSMLSSTQSRSEKQSGWLARAEKVSV